MKHYSLMDSKRGLYVAIKDGEVTFVKGSANASIFSKPVEDVIAEFSTELEQLWETSLVWESNGFTRNLDK